MLKRRIMTLLAVLAMLCTALIVSPATANATSVPPTGQTVHGQGPVGYVQPPTGGGTYWIDWVVKDGAEIQAWYPTGGARCYYVGVNTLNDPATHDGIGRWICEESKLFHDTQSTPPGTPLTIFYVDQHGWYHGVDSGVTGWHLDTSVQALYRYSFNNVSHRYTVDSFWLI